MGDRHLLQTDFAQVWVSKEAAKYVPVEAGCWPVSAGEIIVRHVCHCAEASKYVCASVCFSLFGVV